MPDDTIWTTATLKEHVDALFAAHEARDIDRFLASQTALAVALVAQQTALSAAQGAADRLVSASFAASDRAIIKQEDAQREDNARAAAGLSLVDVQMKQLMPRAETDTRFLSLEEKLMVVQKTFEDRLAAHAVVAEKQFDLIGTDIKSLRESRSEFSGRRVHASEMVAYVIAVMAIVVGILLKYLH